MSKANDYPWLLAATTNQIAAKLYQTLRWNKDKEFFKIIAEIVVLESKEKNNELKLERILNHSNSGKPLIPTAAKLSKFNVIKELIKYKPNVNVADEFGKVAMNFAIEKNNVETAKLLLENGALSRPAGTNGEPDDSFWIRGAIKKNNVEMCELLIDSSYKFKYCFDWVCLSRLVIDRTKILEYSAFFLIFFLWCLCFVVFLCPFYFTSQKM